MMDDKPRLAFTVIFP